MIGVTSARRRSHPTTYAPAFLQSLHTQFSSRVHECAHKGEEGGCLVGSWRWARAWGSRSTLDTRGSDCEASVLASSASPRWRLLHHTEARREREGDRARGGGGRDGWVVTSARRRSHPTTYAPAFLQSLHTQFSSRVHECAHKGEEGGCLVGSWRWARAWGSRSTLDTRGSDCEASVLANSASPRWR